MVTIAELSIFVPLVSGIIMPIVLFFMMQRMRMSTKRDEYIDTELREILEKINSISSSMRLFEWRLGIIERRMNGGMGDKIHI